MIKWHFGYNPCNFTIDRKYASVSMLLLSRGIRLFASLDWGRRTMGVMLQIGGGEPL